jgi:predicted transcriptional regulator
MKELTKAEEQIMQYLWRLKKGFLKDIVEQFPEPKPAYTTVSTVIRVLVKKGFIGYNTYGKVHEYFPKVMKRAYTKSFFSGVFSSFFDKSASGFTSFFTKEADLSLTDLEEMKRIIEDQIKERKEGSDD